MDVPEEQKQHVRKLLKEGKRILAIKYLSQNFGLPLKDAKRMADLIEQDIINDGETLGVDKGRPLPNMKGCFVGKIFQIISLILLGLALYFFIDDYELVSNGEQVIATVVDSPSKPVFEYEVNGEIFTFESSVTSTPPSYYLGEEVAIYVDPNQPNEILIDTFTDRWLAITILGSMGTIFLLIGTVTARLFSRMGNLLNK